MGVQEEEKSRKLAQETKDGIEIFFKL